MNKIRVLVVEDQAVVREGLVAMLAYVSDIEVVAQAEDGIHAISLLQQVRPDVILLDLVMPRQDGLATIPMIMAIMPDAHILVLTSFADDERVFQAIKSGALGYMLKDATREQLLQSIRDVAQGQASLHPSIALKVITEMGRPKDSSSAVDPLTRREIETLRLISCGMSNKEISLKVHVHERTIAKYVSSILSKLHLANRTQAALYAVREGISQPTD